MGWRYQLIAKAKNSHGNYVQVGLHEVYLNDEGDVYRWTEEPVSFFTYFSQDTLDDLRVALEDAHKYPVLYLPDLEKAAEERAARDI